MIHIIRTRATPQQMSEMLETLGTYVKADWNLTTQQVTFESLINIRPRQNNPALEILDREIQQQVAHITRELLGGV